MIANEQINSNHFHLPDTPKDENVAKAVAEENSNANEAAKEDAGESNGGGATTAAAAAGPSAPTSASGLVEAQKPEASGNGHDGAAALGAGEYAQQQQQPQQTNMFMQDNNNQLNECKAQAAQPALFSNFVPDSNDKIWSLLDNNQEFNAPEYAENFNKTMSPFADPNLVQKNAAAMMKKSTSPRNDGAFNMAPAAPSYSNFGRNQYMGPMASGHSNGNIRNNANMNNWPINTPNPAQTMQSSLTWSNNFNAAQPSVPSFSNMTNNNNNNMGVPNNAWQNNFGGGPSNNFIHPKRSVPMGNANNMMGMKKQGYNPNEVTGQLNYGNNQMGAAKYRQNNMQNFKNFANNQIYDMGSTGSDNTSSSSDSANVLFQNRHMDPNCGPLDTLRYSLEPHLMEMARTTNMPQQDGGKGSAMNYPFQTLDDKKQIKSRNFGKSPFFTGQHGETSENLFFDANATNQDQNERFSRKVFVGGLPPDIDEEEITASFRRFGPLVVDWPHKAESKSYFPPKGYAFLLFQDEASVQMLIDACMAEDDKLYLCVSSPTIKDKAVQIRPWRLSDADYVLDGSLPLDPRKTVFVGGVPRPLKAIELAMIMDRLYGGVCYAGIDTDPELKYPKGAGRVAFSSQQSYIAAISARFVQLQHADIEKRVEVKPYVLDDQNCDECQGARCGGKFAPFFCANIHCLQYYCENCWATIHSRPGREFHKPLVKEGADRPRAVPFRWC